MALPRFRDAALFLITISLGAGCSQPTSVGTGGGGGHGGAASVTSAIGVTSTHATSSVASGSTGSGPTSCTGVTCSGQGTCAVDMGQAVCTCNAGYHSTGADCAIDQVCTSTTCGNCADCQVVAGVTQCNCPQGYALQGKDCQLATDPCANANCDPSTQYCVAEAHCQPLGACVPKCDCSNCPNCSPDNTNGKWNDMQEYCGAQPDQQPATMVCNTPCPSGMGCLPYATQFCWPLEGCFSL